MTLKDQLTIFLAGARVGRRMGSHKSYRLGWRMGYQVGKMGSKSFREAE